MLSLRSLIYLWYTLILTTLPFTLRGNKKEEKKMDKFFIAVDKEAEKKNKEIWTKETIEAHGKSF